MRVLVTGSAGFIGRSLCKKLLKEGYEVFGLDMIETPIKHRAFKSLVGDITDSRYFELNGSCDWWWNETDFVFHLAAMANVDIVNKQRYEAFKVNLLGTFNVVEACRKYNIPMIFASTCSVYGNTTQHPSKEDGPTNPVSWYGITKRADEELVKGLLKHWVILRFGTTVGPEMRPTLTTAIFLDQAHNGKPFTISDNGQQTRNWIYIDDLIEGCYLVLKKKIKNEIINLAGKKSYTIYRMAEMCAEVVNGTAANTSWKFLPAREGDVFKEDISIKKAKELLGWQPKVDLKKALEISYKKRYR